MKRGERRIDADGVEWEIVSVTTLPNGKRQVSVRGPHGRFANEDEEFEEGSLSGTDDLRRALQGARVDQGGLDTAVTFPNISVR